MYPDYSAAYKICMIGDYDVGQDKLFSRFTGKEFNFSDLSSLGYVCGSTNRTINGKCIKLNFQNLGGQERFQLTKSAAYRASHGIIIVFDATKSESFNNVQAWLTDIKRCIEPDSKIFLIGTNCDLHDQRAVEFEWAKGFADNHDIVYIETGFADETSIQRALDGIGGFLDQNIKPRSVHCAFFQPPKEEKTDQVTNDVTPPCQIL